MARFLIRVELNNADEPAYEKLHQLMYAAGFYRVIQGDTNIWYDLPTGTYYGDSSNDYEAVSHEVKGILDALRAEFNSVYGGECIIAETTNLSFYLIRNEDKSKLPPGAVQVK